IEHGKQLYKTLGKELLEGSSRTSLYQVLVNPVTSYEKRFHKPFILSTAIHAPTEEAILWAIDEILITLKDGNWHDLSAITKKYSSNKLRAEMILSFLSKYDFMELDKKGRKARLLPLMLEFMNEIQCTKEEKAVKP
ncbi:hypothetical protein GWO13_07530, partial [Candidatus Bathyarchaeota archaeon]|nr:hypothetical protein [Candidatus Bathyarchaeota archaeon]